MTTPEAAPTPPLSWELLKARGWTNGTPNVFIRTDGASVRLSEDGTGWTMAPGPGADWAPWTGTAGLGGNPHTLNAWEGMDWIDTYHPCEPPKVHLAADGDLGENTVHPADEPAKSESPCPPGWRQRSNNLYRRIDGVKIQRSGAERWVVSHVPGLKTFNGMVPPAEVMAAVDGHFPFRDGIAHPAVAPVVAPVAAPVDDFPPIPDKADPEAEIAAAIAEDAARMLDRLSKMLRSGSNVGRALRITGAYIDANREVVKMLGLPDNRKEGRGRRRGGRFGRRYLHGADFGDDDDEVGGIIEAAQQGGLVMQPDDEDEDEDRLNRRLRGHGRAHGDPQDQMMGMLAESNRTQQIQALSIALRNAERGTDVELTARIRAELNLLLPGGERRGGQRDRRAPRDPAGRPAPADPAATGPVGPVEEDDDLDEDNETLPNGRIAAAAAGLQQGMVGRLGRPVAPMLAHHEGPIVALPPGPLPYRVHGE